MTDEKILRGLRQQNPDALQAMMEQYSRYLYAIVAGILGKWGTHEDIQELVQDTFYAVWNHADAIHGKLKPYLCTTARNRAKTLLRSQKPLPMSLDLVELPDPMGNLEDAAMQRELEQLIQQALGRMRPKDREIFLRYYYCLQTTEEIAAALHMPSATVRSRLVRGRKALAKELEKEVSQ